MKAQKFIRWASATLFLGISCFLSNVILAGGARVPPPQADDGLYGQDDLSDEFKEKGGVTSETTTIFMLAVRYHRRRDLQTSLKLYQELQDVILSDGQRVNMTQVSVVVTHNLAMLYATAGRTDLASKFQKRSERLQKTEI